MVNGYRGISLFNHIIEVPNVPLREHVDIHMIPDLVKQIIEIRIWWNDKMVRSVTYPLQGFRVHLCTSKVSTFQLLPTGPELFGIR